MKKRHTREDILMVELRRDRDKNQKKVENKIKKM